MSEQEATAAAENAGSTEPKKVIGHELVSQVINGRFRVLSVLDHGGMGVIYRAEQMPLGRTVALKVLLPSMVRMVDSTFRDRFFLEASTCARFKSAHTVTIHDFGEFGEGNYYIAMELLTGRSLKQVIEEEAPLAPARVLHIVRQSCLSLSEAHKQGVIHRDIKPANIFLVSRASDSDFVKVLDFGLVKELGEEASDLTVAGTMMGSPRFMSPEQVRGGVIDARSDIYALGAVMYRALTGQHVFDGAEPFSIVLAHVNDAPRSFSEVDPSLSIPASLEALVLRCLEKDPNHRYANLAELVEGLDSVAPDVGFVVPETSMSFSRAQVPAAVAGADIGGLADDPMAEASVVAPSPAVDAPTKKGPPPIIYVAVLAVVLAAAAYFGLSGQSNEVAPPVQPAAVEPAPVEAVPEPVVAAPKTFPLTVTTTPEGASLFRDGVDLGDSPVELRMPEGGQWTLEAKKDGYLARKVTVSAGQATVNIALKAEPVVAKPKPSKQAPKPAKQPAKSSSNSDLRDPWGN